MKSTRFDPFTEPLAPTPAKSDLPQFRLWSSRTVSWRFMVFFFASFSCLAYFTQQVSLPLYIHTLGGFGGPYFVIWFCSLFFTVFFGFGALVLFFLGEISPSLLQLRWQKWMVVVGFCDALNGVLSVYSAPLSRVPGPLQAILLQASSPLTLFVSKLILKDRTYNWKQLASVAMSLVGVFYSLIPMFVRAAKHDQGAGMHVGAWWWPLITIAGIVPGVLMNVVQEDLQEKYRSSFSHSTSVSPAATTRPSRMSVFFLQGCESFYQLGWMSVFWAFDIIPEFGTNPRDLAGFSRTFQGGFKCFFRTSEAIEANELCNYAAAFGLVFITAYIINYIAGTYLTLYATANYGSIVSALPPVGAMIFWFALPSVNRWGSGTPYPLTGFDGAMNLTALAIILPAVYFYRRFETDNKAEPVALAETAFDTGPRREDLKYFPLF
eukprot:c12692_g1_i1.p1 GENE.c12692_g1_i1~~c12692_g1_i1.p1  ORF type:complete len:436 (+),score=60.82 c12692_g1_i1:60-1367(+)